MTWCVDGTGAEGITVTLDDGPVTTETDVDGRYSFAVIAGTGTDPHTVTPSHAALIPPDPHIDTGDVLSILLHFLAGGNGLVCPEAGDVNEDGRVTTIDVVGVQRFFLGHPDAIGATGQYRFTPLIPSAYDFSARILGDVSSLTNATNATPPERIYSYKPSTD